MPKEVFVQFIRSYLQDVPPKIPADISPVSLYQIAERQNLLPVMGYMQKKYAMFTDPDLVKSLQNIFYQTVLKSNNRCYAFRQVSAKFSEQGIRHMPVKGWYIRELYAVPELRTFGDIDVLISREDREKTDRLMREWGYTVKTDWEPTYTYCRGDELYEIHTNLMDSSLDGSTDLPAYFEAAWDHAMPLEACCMEPEHEFHFLYVICHLAKHLYAGGAGLRMYMDAAVFLQKYNERLHWDEIDAEMKELGLHDFLCTVLTAVETWFGISAAYAYERTAPETIEALLEYTLDADLFGKMHDHSVIRSRNSDYQSKKSLSKGNVLKQIMFPSYDELVKRYTYIENRPWLLPAAWVHRVVLNAKAIPKYRREMQKIISTSEETVKAYDDFMMKIGL